MRRNPTGFVNGSKDRPSCDRCLRCPILKGVSYPIWNGHRANVAAFANEVCKNPMLFSLLQILHGYCRKFGPTQTVSKKYGDYGVIS